MRGSPSLLDLPEEVICALLRHLDATSLYLLGRTCTRLNEIITNDFTLWKRIDARRVPNTKEKILYCLDRCYDDGNSWTHTLLLRGDNENFTLENFFPKLNSFNKLSVLACENLAIDGSKYNVMAFPPQLQELSLKKTTVTNSLEFFKNSGDHFTNLKVLILDCCDWLNSIAFMPISKYKNLEILSVYKCRNLENSIAYLSLASQGFKALKILDARLSPLGNTLVRAIYRLHNLVAIYLQNEDATYKLDYLKRKLEILKGAPTRDFYTRDDEFNDICDEMTEETGFMDNDGLADYIALHSESKKLEFPKSVLYLDPYNLCTCGYELKQELNTPTDDSDDSGDSPHHFITRKIKHLSDSIRKNSHRGLGQNPRNRNPSTEPSLQDSEDSGYAITLYIYPRSSRSSAQNDTEEPPSKRQKIADDAGPSGLNQSSDSETDEASMRPPTPHPDVAINQNERNPTYRIYFRDVPVVQIENIREAHRGVMVPLRRLSLRGYKKITDMALNYIKGLELDILDLTYTGVSYEGIQNYLKSHPLCRVVHEKFCTCLPNLHF